MAGLPRDEFHDQTLVVVDQNGTRVRWDGAIRNYIYNSSTLSWSAWTGAVTSTGGGDATAANQVIGNNSLANIDANQGAKTDAAASTDTGTFSLIALFKRSLQSLTTLNAKDFATSAQQTTIITETATKYIFREDIASTTVSYYGWAVPGTLDTAASWRIMKLDSSTGTKTYYAAGNTNFSNIWANRASLAYS